MTLFKNKGIRIAGMACAIPDNHFGREEFLEIFNEETIDKFASATGIRNIYRALPEQTAGDLAFAAAQELLTRTGTDPEQIDGLFFVTQSPDYRRPSTGCVLHGRLGLPEDCATMEISLGCSGFIYGMQTAMSMMQTSDMKRVLFLSGDTASKLVNPEDKSVAMMFGDAGTAVLLERDEESCMNSLLKTDGSRFQAIILPAGGFRDMDPSHEKFTCSDGIERSLYDLYMDGTSVFAFSVMDVPVTIKEFLEKTGKTADDYDAFFSHQANAYILKQLSKKLKISRENMPVSLDRYGNTGGNSIPLTICDTFGNISGETKKVLSFGFGVGLSWGVADFEIDTDAVFPIIRTKDYFREGKLEGGTY